MTQHTNNLETKYITIKDSLVTQLKEALQDSISQMDKSNSQFQTNTQADLRQMNEKFQR